MKEPSRRISLHARPESRPARDEGHLLFSVLAGTIFTAALAACLTLPAPVLDRPGSLALLVVLAAVVGLRPVRIPALRLEVSPTEPFILYALLVSGPLSAVLVAAVAYTAGAAGDRRGQKTSCQVSNLGTLLLSVAVAGHVFLRCGGAEAAELTARMAPLMAAAAVHFAINTSLTANAIAYETRGSIFRVWRRSCLWTAVPMSCGVMLAAGMLLLGESFGPLGLALGLPAVLAVSAFHRLHGLAIQALERSRVSA